MLVEAGAIRRLPALLAWHAPKHRVMVIADATVAACFPDLLPEAPRFVFPAGESSKTVATWDSLTDQLLKAGANRNTVIVALGGGVSTDLAGFVAATLLRGVPWLAVPTTTLAMVDAAIGGKTGVDSASGKNLIGAFHHPVAVVVDPDLLTTLPDEIFRQGLAEVVKHAAIADADQWQWLARNVAAIRSRDTDTITAMLRTSAAIKATVVSGDPREAGYRAVLNAGHTVAHALEHATDYIVPHGHAVAIGLVTETRVAEQLNLAPVGTADRVTSLLDALELPSAFSGECDRVRFRAALAADKKNRDGTVRCALLADIGRVAGSDAEGWTTAVDPDALVALLPD